MRAAVSGHQTNWRCRWSVPHCEIVSHGKVSTNDRVRPLALEPGGRVTTLPPPPSPPQRCALICDRIASSIQPCTPDTFSSCCTEQGPALPYVMLPLSTRHSGPKRQGLGNMKRAMPEYTRYPTYEPHSQLRRLLSSQSSKDEQPSITIQPSRTQALSHPPRWQASAGGGWP